MSMSRSDRRLGRRYETTNATMTWRVPRRKLLRTKVEDEPITMVNVSTTGAAVVASAVADFERGSLVVLDCDGVAIEATIRRIVPDAEREDVRYYGLQFVNPDSAAIERLLSRTEAASRAVLEEYWRHAG